MGGRGFDPCPGWGAYFAGFDGDWRGIACDGEYLPPSCGSKAGWRKFELTITLAQLIALPILAFKGIRSASGTWFDRGWMLWLSAGLLICIAVAPLITPGVTS